MKVQCQLGCFVALLTALGDLRDFCQQMIEPIIRNEADEAVNVKDEDGKCEVVKSNKIDTNVHIENDKTVLSKDANSDANINDTVFPPF